MSMRIHISKAAVAVLLLLAVVGCGSPEEKKAKYLAQAQDYIQDGNLPKARVALRNVLKIDPKDPEAYFVFAQVEENEKNWRSAFANYQRTVELKPDHVKALLKLAKFYLEGRAVDKVLEMTNKVLEKSPEQVEAQALKIAVQAVNGNLPEATLAAEALGAKHPTDPDAAIILATLYLAQGRGDQVEPVMQRAVDANPNNFTLLDSFASALLRLNKSEQAEEVLKKIVAAEPKVLDHRLRLAGFYDERHDYDKAESILHEVIKLDPDNEQRYLGLASFQVSRRGISEGEASLVEAKRALPRSTAIQFALGELYELSKQPDKARSQYEQVRDDQRTKPAALEAMVKLAALDWAAGKQEAAEKQLAEVLKENPRSLEAIFLQGKIAMQRGNGKDAIQAFRTVLKDRPELAEAHTLLGRAYLMTSEVALARESFEQAVLLNPKLTEVHMTLAALDGSSGKLKEARARLESLLSLDPNNLQTLSMLLNIQASDKDWAATDRTLSKARSAGADSSVADMTEGRLAEARQEWDRARHAFDRAITAHPDAPEPLIALVQLDIKQKKIVQAKERLELVLARNPAHPYATGLLGEISLVDGDQAAAESRFKEATRIKPDWPTPWLHLATLKLSQRKVEEALELLENGLKAIPKSEELRLLLATTVNDVGQIDRAIKEYETLLQQNPKALVAANNLASLLVDRKGDPQSLSRALALTKEFETSAPNPYFLDTLGWVHLKLGHQDEALRVIRLAAAKAPDHPVVNYHLGMAYLKSGHTAEAKTHLQKAVASQKTFEGLDDAQSVLAQLQG
jgi:tetratricopeptide (TPR) repeat protein